MAAILSALQWANKRTVVNFIASGFDGLIPSQFIPVKVPQGLFDAFHMSSLQVESHAYIAM